MTFVPGDPVRVIDAWPEAAGPVHIRTPHYIRGASGVVTRRLGDFPNPEDLAFGRPAALTPLYHVQFDLLALWPPGEPGSNAPDTLLVEIFDHWLVAR